ncbi:LOW QUALITY PROTEIN: tetraspanin-16 [Nannospalax galili]|uniref:LOW QUALITY PROTEIN: tetraspanin-16 n=1 Tax=Nannospalax galili TaxID=1026970 RepID=UPI0004ED19BA|nr:LOW QUALITY PROTEIN: tetraspanin-16 [Nannospalax galili]
MAETHTPYSFLKKLLSFFNGFVAVSGMVLIGLGLWVKYGEATLTRVLGCLSSAHFLHFGYVSLGMGGLTIVLSLAGWYGATKENRHTRGCKWGSQPVAPSRTPCFLFLVLILIAEVTAASVVLAFFSIVQDVALEHTLLILRRDYRGYKEPDDFSAQWNEIMEKVMPAFHAILGCFDKLLQITKAQTFTLSRVSLGAAAMQLPGILTTLLLFIKLG